MDSEIQVEIDSRKWYHDFDFPGGLRARSGESSHIPLWKWIEECLNTVEFREKSVLDIGCWDGYWSFMAERRGARSVLATDDMSQNWGSDSCIYMAKKLLGSTIEINQQVSIYNASSLQRTFDVILCLGVYYHLYAPLCGLAQLRHLCGRDSVVVLEGDVARGYDPGIARCCFPEYNGPQDENGPAFLPSDYLLRSMIESAYLSVSEVYYFSARAQDFVSRCLRTIKRRVKGNRIRRFLRGKRGLYADPDRAIYICRPFVGVNPRYVYRPPFGLDRFDTRFHGKSAAA